MHLPVGVSNFKDLISNKDPKQQGYLYVDKTNFIKEIIYDLTPVIILTRPRRFGKTLNLSMLHHFFAAEVEGHATKGLFDHLAIFKDSKCMEYQGKYPVIFITLKDVKETNFTLCLENIKSIMAAVYRQHRVAWESNNIPKDDLIYIEKILEEKVTRIQLQDSIKRLLELLTNYYKERPILLIDEYDTPLQEAFLNGYYEELIKFFRNFLSKPLKDYNLLNRAIFTGILRVSKESLFSGLSNIEIYSVLDHSYCQYFGFTELEVNELLSKAKIPVNMQQTKEWYNGYNFGGATIYNPWSIIKFIKDKGRKLRSYWINTSDNELVKNIIIKSSYNVQGKIADLIAGNAIKEYIDEHIVFSDLQQKPDAIWGLLLMSGYLTYIYDQPQGRRNLCELKLPNQEVEDFYNSVIEEWLTGDRGVNWYIDFITDLKDGRIVQFEEKLQTLVEEALSFHDVSKKSQESFYHGLLLAFVTGLKKTYTISSNRESGTGRYDLALIPVDPSKLGIIMEFKAIDNPAKLEEVAIDALTQIKNSKYTTELKSKGITNICAMGISFSGKAVKVVAENN